MRNDTSLPHIDPDAWDDIIVPISGGKDSQTLLSLALATPRLRPKVTVCHNHTGYDHSLTLAHMEYMREFYGYDDAVVTRSAKYEDIFDLIRKERYFPSSLARNCTSRMKIKPFALWLHVNGYAKRRTLVLMGMRAAESANRADQYGDLTCDDYFSICDISKDYQKRIKAVQVNLSIVQWSTSEVFDYLATTGARVNPLYRKGHKRVGCYPCLLAGNDEWNLASQDPEGRAHMQTLVDIQAEFMADTTHKHKLIKIHPVRDVPALLAKGPAPDPFGLNDGEDSGCALCNI